MNSVVTTSMVQFWQKHLFGTPHRRGCQKNDGAIGWRISAWSALCGIASDIHGYCLVSWRFSGSLFTQDFWGVLTWWTFESIVCCFFGRASEWPKLFSLVIANLVGSLRWEPDVQGGRMVTGERAPAIYVGHDVGWWSHLQLDALLKQTSGGWSAALYESILAQRHLQATHDEGTRIVLWKHIKDYLNPALNEAGWWYARARWSLARFFLACHLRKAPIKPLLWTMWYVDFWLCGCSGWYVSFKWEPWCWHYASCIPK